MEGFEEVCGKGIICEESYFVIRYLLWSVHRTQHSTRYEHPCAPSASPSPAKFLLSCSVIASTLALLALA